MTERWHPMQEIDKARAKTLKAEKEAEIWRKIATQAFVLQGGHIEGCRMGLCCNCGFAMYFAILDNEKATAEQVEKTP